ncbi:MAG TPA: 2OG-Fe(II) oxygenase [Burkholderiales bacterium]|nr:2OG-Fe(II) oxygenase [Burkholderiales bacterium]
MVTSPQTEPGAGPIADRAASAIAGHGIAVIENFLPEDMIATLRAEARRLQAQGAFRPAGIGAGGDFRKREDIRGDEIYWFDADSAPAALRPPLAAFEELRLVVNRELQLGLFDFECHLARYAPGAGYQRHYDQLRDDGHRQLTVSLYLNENWREADGGLLRVYLEDGERTLEVIPEGGTLVAFLSARFSHEVLPCTRERLSFTGWFRRR